MYPGITLVTGATGFIGRHLVKRLVAGGVRVRATGRSVKDDFFNELGVEFIPADVSLPHTLPPLFRVTLIAFFTSVLFVTFPLPMQNWSPSMYAVWITLQL